MNELLCLAISPQFKDPQPQERKLQDMTLSEENVKVNQGPHHSPSLHLCLHSFPHLSQVPSYLPTFLGPTPLIRNDQFIKHS